jgi:lipoate-protein ligase B
LGILAFLPFKASDQNDRDSLPKLCIVHKLGLLPYHKAYRLQKSIRNKRIEGRVPDTILLLEHPPTFTIGKSGSIKNILISKNRLPKEEISLFFADRAGDVTYHGPGQIVAYVIFDLRRRENDIYRFVRDLEDVLITTAKDFSIRALRDNNHPGIWVNGEELAAIGLSVERWVTMHGFALNVNPNLGHFSFINPCGFSDRKATSMSNILAQEVPIKQVIDRLLIHFAQIFDVSLKMALAW